MRLLIASACALFLLHSAYGAPPENADPALAPWFQSLHQPNGASCCSEADCRPVDARMEGDHYQAFVRNRWLDIPNQKVIPSKSNPTGRAVLCMQPENEVIFCFVRPAET